MIEVRGLTKKYGEHLVLNGVSLTLEKGVYGLLGANGAGKSTLMNLITDNIKRTSGEILYNGTDIRRLGAGWRKRVGYTPQLQGMYEDFSARAFLHYIGTLKGMRRRECKRQTEEFLEVVGLRSVAHRRLGSFSGGMRQRVLIAAAMLDRPEVVILDEPTAGLDPEERIRLRNYISEMARDRIVLLATHVVSDIESIAETVFVLSKGTIVVQGSPRELISGVQERVFEYQGDYTTVVAQKQEYKKGQILQAQDGYVLRVVSKEAPDGFLPAKGVCTLEDVFLYYTEGRQ